ncbi:phage tail protein [Ligilactobacillus salivarius]|uniref:Peptidase M23 n=1 Tax=Ligilactobacillus salivarius TaxID=1624 RepID=A0A1V9TUT1_9LACO|nr:phage tail protein [Ligilactobacillus salivarius]OQR21450.1 peptidase M23 [Ligilactobacillus salivarius]OQR23546.1 peptidase M23 [Ligilactobacillus salivarius]OQR25518.1 peptidase M23 [Ligilactobacillus salivarius]
MFQGKILVQGVNRAEKEPLNLFDPKSVQIQWEVNQTWSLQLTAYNDGSLAYQMLESEASIFLDNQEYIIKQVADDSSSGLDSVQVTATHVYFEVQKIRKYKDYIDPIDKDKQTDVKVLKTDSTKSDDSDNTKTDTNDKTEGNTTTKITTKTTDETQQDNQNQVTYSIQDVLDHWLKDNNLGFTYEVIGSFEKKELEELKDGTGADMLSKISDTWNNAIIYPDNRKIRVYLADKFNLNRGNRIDYLNNANEIKFSTDSTSLTNMVYCIGGKYSVETTTETTTTTTTTSGGWGWPFPDVGEGNFMQVQRFGNDGGYRQNGFHDGLDFGSVDHPGRDVHAIHGGKVTIKSYMGGLGNYVVISGGGYNVVYQEAFSSASNIIVNVGDTVKVGDVIGYRDTNHLHVGVTKADFNVAVGKSFTNDGTWLDPLELIKNGPSDTDTETSSETNSNSNTQEYYYFAPFMYRDEESIKKYGEHPAEPIEDGRFKDKNAMIEYVKTKLQPEPSLSIDVTTTTDIKPIAGDVVHVMVKSQNISTNFTLTGFTWYPYSYTVDNPTSITLNSNVQDILDYQNSRQRQFSKAISKLKSSTNEIVNNVNNFNEYGGNQQLQTWLNDFVGG